ncbi:DUF6122 family protein [Aureisphaera galaxeae]|uniref:DUF6122 family protein n=1 Tax=Aureisphaera galaxeae TaxID=1538023 RepID=UPI002350CD78|nr:DUF6122 family protein [Aureisphaera galaxeae]MDC8003714.1 DUF6122 family protein [Aureisphaera galaxeae]
MLQSIVHYSLHLWVPGVLAYVFFRKHWKRAWLLMVLTMVIDLDHLMASPIFDPNRCSINFHPLHTYWALAIYVLLLFFRKTRVIGLGLVLHIIADSIDCLWMQS